MMSYLLGYRCRLRSQNHVRDDRTDHIDRPRHSHRGGRRPDNGLENHSVINCDNILTIPIRDVGRQIGWLLPRQEPDLARAVNHAFGLRPDEVGVWA